MSSRNFREHQAMTALRKACGICKVAGTVHVPSTEKRPYGNDATKINVKARFRQKWGIETAAPIEVVASDPARSPCLQAADYFLWAVQRCFERSEHRYLDLLWPQIGLIVDRDDTRKSGAGEYYPGKRQIPHGFRQPE